MEYAHGVFGELVEDLGFEFIHLLHATNVVVNKRIKEDGNEIGLFLTFLLKQ